MISEFQGGQLWLLICTDILGRGIDFPSVNLVINFDCPNSEIAYIHRIGLFISLYGFYYLLFAFLLPDKKSQTQSVPNYVCTMHVLSILTTAYWAANYQSFYQLSISLSFFSLSFSCWLIEFISLGFVY